MTDFEASNGAKVEAHSLSLSVEMGLSQAWFEPWAVEALRQFFQHERDEALGRWRWPEDPDYIVYPRADKARVVVRESDGSSAEIDRDHPRTNNYFTEAAFAYSDTLHQPWHDAKPGEAWVVTWHEGTYPLLVADFAAEGRVFADAEEAITVPIVDSEITQARRIWPEPTP